MRLLVALLTSLMLPAAQGPAARASPPDGPPAPVESKAAEGATPIFLKTPADRDEFWKMLSRPDFVILDGDLYRKLRQASEASRPGGFGSSAVVGSVAIGGEADGDWARLTIELRVALGVDSATWVPIHLDGLTLTEVREGARDLPARVSEDRSWSVELAGRGDHVVRVGVTAPIRTTPGGRRLDLAIPPAASTTLGLEARQPVLSATAGPDEPVGIGPVQGRPGISRINGRLGPRSRLELTWREPPSGDLNLPPLLSCQGDIAVEVEPGSIRTRSTWLISALRGSAARLTVRLDPAEEVVDIHVDDRPVPFEAKRLAGRLVIGIPLPGPVAGDRSTALAITSRRAFAGQGPSRVVLGGSSFDEAKVQSGVLAISRTGPLFLNPTPGRAIRRIDPRTDLPEGLRARQDTALAFEFNDQPFELQLGIDPAPPRLRVEARTTLAVEARSARIETRLECRVTQGRPFEVRVLVPRGLVFEEAGPPELVAAPQLVAEEPSGADADRPRTLVLPLNRQPRESESFTIRLRGRAYFDRPGPVSIPLFRPLPDSSIGGRIEILGDRNLAVELDDSRDDAASFRPDRPAITALPQAPTTSSTGVEPPLLGLRYDSDPASIPLRVAILPRTIRHDTVLTATVDREGAEVVDEVAVEVAHGSVSALEVLVPPEVPADWDIDGLGPAARELLGREADGSRRVRVAIPRSDAGSFRLRFRYRSPLKVPATPGDPSKLRLAPIRVVEGISASATARIVAEAGVAPHAEGEGWSGLDPPSTPAAGLPTRVALSRTVEGAGPIEVEVRPAGSVVLPVLIASRLWLRTSQRADDELATSANYWLESRGRSITLALPPGSRWTRARVGGVEIGAGDLARLGPDVYRVDVPNAVAPGPTLVGVEYVTPASATVDGWPAPELRDGLVEQTLWEFHTIGTRAGVGIPRDWTDENEWFWDGILWRRRPWRSSAEVARWLAGGASLDRLAGPVESAELHGGHSYLFSRPGPPSRLRFLVYSRLTLLLFCSGPVLLSGLVVLARRPRPRLLAASILVVAFAVGTFLDFDAALLVVESSALGFVLLLAAVGMNSLLDRRVGHLPARAPAPIEATGRMTISATGHAATAGSDDSTAIRPRPAPPVASTADHIHPTKAPGRAGGDSLTTDLKLR